MMLIQELLMLRVNVDGRDESIRDAKEEIKKSSSHFHDYVWLSLFLRNIMASDN
jgi:hypothetical protein